MIKSSFVDFLFDFTRLKKYILNIDSNKIKSNEDDLLNIVNSVHDFEVSLLCDLERFRRDSKK